MKLFAEFGFFVAVATASHLVLFDGDSIGAPDAAGNAGTAALTLEASSESLSAMVAAWERPVEAMTQMELMAAPTPMIQQSPIFPTAAPAAPRQPLAQSDVPLPDAQLPQIDTSVPPPPQRYAATESARPQLRPEEPAKPTPQKNAARKKAAAKPASKQTAAGAGNSKAAGTTNAAKSPAKQQANTAALMAQWGNTIRSAVERRKSYPSGSRAQGKVMLAVAVSSNGALAGVSVRRSSGHAALDQAAVAAVRRARFKPAPSGLAAGVHQFSLPISFGR
jgi:protein TonB